MTERRLVTDAQAARWHERVWNPGGTHYEGCIENHRSDQILALLDTREALIEAFTTYVEEHADGCTPGSCAAMDRALGLLSQLRGES